MATRTYEIKTKQADGTWEVYRSIGIDTSLYTDYTDFQWDSRTGLVSALDANGNRVVIPHTEGGKGSLGTISPGPIQTTGIEFLEYNYIYF